MGQEHKLLVTGHEMLPGERLIFPEKKIHLCKYTSVELILFAVTHAPHTTGCCFGSSVPGAGRGTTGSSHIISTFNGRAVRVLRPPCARGGCSGQGRSFEWTTADCPDGSWWGSSRTQAGVDGEARRKSGRTAWQTTYGCSGSGMGKDEKLWH